MHCKPKFTLPSIQGSRTTENKRTGIFLPKVPEPINTSLNIYSSSRLSTQAINSSHRPRHSRHLNLLDCKPSVYYSTQLPPARPCKLLFADNSWADLHKPEWIDLDITLTGLQAICILFRLFKVPALLKISAPESFCRSSQTHYTSHKLKPIYKP